MSIPASLYPGLVSIYGKGSTAGTNGIVPNKETFLFGVVDKTWGGMGEGVTVGQSVLFADEHVTCRVKYDNTIFTIIPESKIILIEDILL